MRRRQFLAGLGGFALSRLLAAQQPPINRKPDPTMGFLGIGPASEEERIAHVEQTLAGFGERYGFRLERLSPRQVAEEKLKAYGGFFVYAAGLQDSEDDRPPFPDGAVRALSRTVRRRGVGLVALHEAAGLVPSAGKRERNQKRRSEWVQLLGGESLGSMPGQLGRVRMADRSVPGLTQLRAGFELEEKWLAFKNFDPEVHVVMVQETAGLEGSLYQRPAYPSCWLRYHGKGRVFYTSLGYELDGWDGEVVRRTVVSGALWVLRDTEADVSANLMRVTPRAIQAVYPV